MTIRTELLDELLKEYKKPEDLIGEGGILKELSKALVERCLNAEIEYQMQEDKSSNSTQDSPNNRRNGYSPKTIKGTFGETTIAVPRDRKGEYEPILIVKGKTRFNGFDDKILTLYARGMTVRDIQEA